MSYKIIRKTEQKINFWSGGITTQLAIYPKDAEYKLRNFKWRLSSAEINEEESVFTSLPGFKRIIMIIKGEVKLDHKNQYEIYLKAFEQDTFMGDWETKSYGKATDLNLMLAKNYNGKIEVINVIDKKNLLIETNKNAKEYTRIFYCVNGIAKIYIFNNKIETLNEGDILINTTSDSPLKKLSFENISKKRLYIIKTEIWSY